MLRNRRAKAFLTILGHAVVDPLAFVELYKLEDLLYSVRRIFDIVSQCSILAVKQQDGCCGLVLLYRPLEIKGVFSTKQ